MNDYKYILFVFKEFGDDDHTPKEIQVIEKITTGVAKGASCGPINLCFFESNRSKEEISVLLKKKKLNFTLVEEKDTVSVLPSYILKLFDNDFSSSDHVRKFGNLNHPDAQPKQKSPIKMSLESQLEEAIKEEDYVMAAKIRDKIATAKEKPKETTAELFKTLFKEE